MKFGLQLPFICLCVICVTAAQWTPVWPNAVMTVVSVLHVFLDWWLISIDVGGQSNEQTTCNLTHDWTNEKEKHI